MSFYDYQNATDAIGTTKYRCATTKTIFTAVKRQQKASFFPKIPYERVVALFFEGCECTNDQKFEKMNRNGATDSEMRSLQPCAQFQGRFSSQVLTEVRILPGVSQGHSSYKESFLFICVRFERSFCACG